VFVSVCVRTDVYVCGVCAAKGLYPALSLGDNQRVKVNFGKDEYRYPRCLLSLSVSFSRFLCVCVLLSLAFCLSL